MRKQMGARDTRVLRAGDELPDTGNELLVDAICVSRRERQVVSTCIFLPLA